MQITIITDEKKVGVDGRFVDLPNIDWAVFNGDPNSPWDDIRVVQFNTDRGQGHVEYRTILTAQAARPDIVPPNWLLSSADFDEHFSWVLPKYEAQVAAEEQKAREAAEAVPVPVEGEAAVQPSVSADEIAALREAVARQDAFIKSMVAESGKVLGGGE